MEPGPDGIDEVRFFRVGSCRAPERAVRSGGPWRRLDLPATVAVLRHPRLGVLLFDTGYAPRYFSLLRKFPYALLGPALGARLPVEEELPAQLLRLGLRPEDIARIVVSHFHLDHIAGLRDFPRAECIFSQDAWKDVATAAGWGAFRRIFHPGCLPPDFAQRSRPLLSADAQPSGTFPENWDVLGDRSIVAVGLPGHAAGQIGIRFQSRGREYFLVADACWHEANIADGESPHPLTALLCHDRRAFGLSLERLRRFAAAAPGVLMLPNHCPRAMARHFTHA